MGNFVQQNKSIMTHTYLISGITCAGCEKKVKSALTAVKGVTEVVVDRASGEVQVTMQQHIATGQLQYALKDYPKYRLTEKNTASPLPSFINNEEKRSWISIYKPLLWVLGYIMLIAVITSNSTGGFEMDKMLRHFMAGFFLAFSFFKMLDLNGFADSYRMYDIVARQIPAWAYIYPFVELGLGLAFVLNLNPVVTNAITLVVMMVSLAGVLQSVFNKRKIRCACLGTVFNLPMTTVTIVEDGLMILMSAWMLLSLI